MPLSHWFKVGIRLQGKEEICIPERLAFLEIAKKLEEYRLSSTRVMQFVVDPMKKGLVESI